MNLKASVALHLLRGRPEIISDRIAQNAEFRNATGLDLRASPYEGWRSLPRSILLDAVRQVAEGKNTTVTDLSGAPVHIAFDGEWVSARRTRPDGTEEIIAPPDLQFFAPDPTRRLQALSSLIAEYGATGPKATRWRPLLEERPATQDEVESLYTEIQESSRQWHTWIREKIDAWEMRALDLVPDESGYFLRLCGPLPQDQSPDEWINGPLRNHRRALLDADLVSGLAAILPGALRHDLGPAALLSDIGDARIWSAIQNLPVQDDPFSLLGLLEIALERRKGHADFSVLADELVERLLAEPFCRPDGVNISILYPALVGLSLQGIRRTEGLGSSPPCWQRLCAFTHAGHLLSIFSDLEFKPQEMADWLSRQREIIDVLGEVLNCRSDPMWTADDLNAPKVRAEVIGRLHLLRIREEEAGRSIPHQEALEAAIEDTIARGLFPYLPGPLEGHHRPNTHGKDRILPEEAATRLVAGLRDDPRSTCGLLMAYAGFIPLDEDIIGLAVQSASSMPLKAVSVSAALTPLMFLALTASRQASASLANAVADRCIGEARNLSTETEGRDRSDLLLRSLLTASTVQPNWKEWLADRLVSYAATMPMGAWHGDMVKTLTAMKCLVPAKDWVFGRAEALARLADR